MKRKASELDGDGGPQTISKRQVARTWPPKALAAADEVREMTLGNTFAQRECCVSQVKQFNNTHAHSSTQSNMGKLLLAEVSSWRANNPGVPCVLLSYDLLLSGSIDDLVRL